MLLVIYQLCRITFLLFNTGYFKPMPATELLGILYGGVRFDLSALMYLNMFYIFMFTLPFNFRYNRVYQRAAKAVFISTNGIGIAANIIDCAYFPFLMRRTNASFFLEFRHDTHLLFSLDKFLVSYWYIALLMAVFVWMLIRSYSLVAMPRQKGTAWKPNLVSLMLAPLVVITWLGFARGSFVPSNRPVNISYAGDYAKRPQDVSLIINTPFSILMTWGNIKIPAVNYFPSLDSAAVYYTPVQAYAAKDSINRKNVVVIVVESLSREFVGALNGKQKGYTPFLDSLISHSLAFKYGFANGKRSIEALPSVIAGIPSHTEAYVLTPYSGNQINSLTSVLKKYGYHTSFFHGAVEGSLGLSGFMKIAGTDYTFSKADYGNDKDDDGTWGIYDENFMQFWAQRLSTFPQPFCSTLFTLSTHHPFKIPEKYQGRFAPGELPIHPSLQFFDLSLREFFETASKMPWYKNTLFIITADHASPAQYYEESNTVMGIFSIPIVFFTPDSSLIGFRNELVQQCDIFPTVINYLGIPDTILAFGSSVLHSDSAHTVFNYASGAYQVYEGDFMLEFGDNRPLALYRFKEDVMLKNNLLGHYQAIETLLTQKVKAYIQQYATRVRENQMLP